MLILREVRNQKRITLEELAEKTGISRRMISAYESHQNDITFTRMKQFADALGVFVLELTSEYVKPEPQQEVADFNVLNEKLSEKEIETQRLEEILNIYKRQVQLLEEYNTNLIKGQDDLRDTNNSLRDTKLLLEEKVMILTEKLAYYESSASSAVRSA